MRQRWLTAGILIPIILLCVWFGGWWIYAIIILFITLATYELSTMLRRAGHRPFTPLCFGLNIFLIVATMLSQPQQHLLLLESGLGIALIISFSWFFFRPKLDGTLVDWALTLASSIYLGVPASLFLMLRGDDASTIHTILGIQVLLPRGAWWQLTLLLGVWGFDGAAFFIGRFFGHYTFASHISPRKTWEGVAGGMVPAIVASLLFTVQPLGIPWYFAIVLGVLLGIAAVLGDLAESLIKRQTQVKDSGQLMPGHGGILDRSDSLLFATIIVYIFAQFFGL